MSLLTSGVESLPADVRDSFLEVLSRDWEIRFRITGEACCFSMKHKETGRMVTVAYAGEVAEAISQRYTVTVDPVYGFRLLDTQKDIAVASVAPSKIKPMLKVCQVFNNLKEVA